MSWSTIIIVVQLIFLEGILSIDNAAVLGAMAAPLPDDRAIPWPSMFGWLGQLLDPLLGAQREAALKVGLLGAYVGRFGMLLAATFIVRNLWLRTIGALYLIYLAVEHIAHMDASAETGDGGEHSIVRQSGFWVTVLSIELADLAFSLDNVVAAITLSNKLWVVMLGVALGIVAMRFAATLFARMIQWEPALQTGAYLLVLSLGIELLLKEIFHFEIGELTQFLISVGILGGTVWVARSGLRDAAFWSVLIQLFKVVYMPFAAVGWLLSLLMNPFRRTASA
jgi:tellurite resistance protein TerC